MTAAELLEEYDKLSAQDRADFDICYQSTKRFARGLERFWEIVDAMTPEQVTKASATLANTRNHNEH